MFYCLNFEINLTRSKTKHYNPICILPENQPVMTEQNFTNHRRYAKGFHFLLFGILFIGFIISVINIFRHRPFDGGFISALLIALLFVCVSMAAYFARTFALKGQDRAIRAEESLRYFILTRKPLDRSLTVGQIAALRFAHDEEFLPLVDRAVAEKLSPDDIKKTIKNWRSDTHRV